MLMDDDFRDNLMKAKTPEEYLAIIDKAEAEQVAAEEEEAAAEEAPAEPETAAPSDRPYVIGVTACPTGIAHTYMAAEAWKTKPLPWVSTSKSKRMAPAVSRTT